MRFVIQRVTSSKVTVNNEIIGQIGKGFMVLIGVGEGDTFLKAGAPDSPKALYEYIISKCKEEIDIVEQGEFGAEMKVELINDGPFTVVLDSDEL